MWRDCADDGWAHRRRANRGRNGRHQLNIVLVLPVPEDCVVTIGQYRPRTGNFVVCSFLL